MQSRQLPCQSTNTSSCVELFSNFSVDPSNSKVMLPPLLKCDTTSIPYVHVDDHSTPSFNFSRHSTMSEMSVGNITPKKTTILSTSPTEPKQLTLQTESSTSQVSSKILAIDTTLKSILKNASLLQQLKQKAVAQRSAFRRIVIPMTSSGQTNEECGEEKDIDQISLLKTEDDNHRSAAGHQGSHLPDNFNECMKGFKTLGDEAKDSISTQIEIV